MAPNSWCLPPLGLCTCHCLALEYRCFLIWFTTDSYLTSEAQLQCPLDSLSPKLLPLPWPCLRWVWGISVWVCVPVPSRGTRVCGANERACVSVA